MIKISDLVELVIPIPDLPPASVPVVGTELLEIYQNGSNKSIAISNLPSSGGGGGPSSASEVSYTNPSYPTVQAALDTLLYVAPTVSFNLSVGTVERGTTITSVVASWTFNKTMTSASLTDASITPSTTTHTFSGLSLTTNKSYTLSFSDGINNSSSTRSISFSDKRYWGVSTLSSLTTAQVLALSSEFSGSRGKTITYDCTGGRYFYYCYPASWGVPTSVTANGFAFSAYTITTQSTTNASGYTTTYNIIRSDTLQSGAAIQIAWS